MPGPNQFIVGGYLFIYVENIGRRINEQNDQPQRQS